MKINVEIDCTPEEARTFFGLPDMTPVHDAMLERMTALARDGLGPADVEKMMRAWMPGLNEQWGEQWQAMQKAFWSAASQAGSKPKKSD